MARSASGTQSRMLGRYREKIVAANKNELNFRLAVAVCPRSRSRVLRNIGKNW